MSSNTPHPEYLGAGGPSYRSDSDAPEGSRRRWPVLGATAAGVAAALGLGGWGAYALLSGGGLQPADALPASAVAYVSLDLDPSAGQKIEAFKILKKFPGIDEELDISSTDDLRRMIFDKVQDEGSCTGLDYDADINPWIGERVALAAVPDDQAGIDAPVLALQVSDEEAAAEGIRALARCADAGDYGYAFHAGYVLITDTDARAEALVADAAQGSLADSAAFQEWTGKVGDPGIVTMYAGPDAPDFLADVESGMSDDWFGYATGDPEAALELRDEQSEASEKLRDAYKDFAGMAGVVRFDDGAVEAEFAMQGLPTGLNAVTGLTGPNVTELPASTGAAFSVALAEGWLTGYLESMAEVFSSGESVDEMLADAERDTGLELPEDIETLFGDGVSVAFDSDVDFEAIFDEGDFTKLPVGLRVSGNPDEILPVVDKVRAAIGPDGDVVVAEPGDGVVAFGANPDYTKLLSGDGTLGSDETFQRAVPEADKASAVLYVNFDAGGWIEEAADAVEAMESGFAGEEAAEDDAAATSLRENVAPLDALGLSAWMDGDVQRGVFRLTTD
ncbi:MAG TPA: DUF3352 domain-containing protein [Nocardioidaceae bacterium]|nr:DUF3352 domain-containing protein [Nocardioidaceae bacterium]